MYLYASVVYNFVPPKLLVFRDNLIFIAFLLFTIFTVYVNSTCFYIYSNQQYLNYYCNDFYFYQNNSRVEQYYKMSFVQLSQWFCKLKQSVNSASFLLCIC